jgi:hypothetical protein
MYRINLNLKFMYRNINIEQKKYLLRLARKISIAIFCNKYRREKIARTSEKYHFP